jgi:hypothetical protein
MSSSLDLRWKAVKLEDGGWHTMGRITNKDDVTNIISLALKGVDWRVKVVSAPPMTLQVDLTVYGPDIVAQRLLGNNMIARLEEWLKDALPMNVKLNFSVVWKESR